PPTIIPVDRPRWLSVNRPCRWTLSSSTAASQRRNADPDASQVHGYSSNALRALTGWAIAQLLETETFSEDERRQLASTIPHAYRHTFGT
ncbi:MAG: hypothetical protein CBHOC_5283, partial [uncultured Caballeronia sp.]